MLLGSSHVGFLIMCGGQTAQWMGKYLGFCPMKKSDCSYPLVVHSEPHYSGDGAFHL